MCHLFSTIHFDTSTLCDFYVHYKLSDQPSIISNILIFLQLQQIIELPC
jgi:hypothetical protein